MNIPEYFSVQMRKAIGNDEYMRLESALDGEPEVSVRINEAKCSSRPGLLDLAGAERVPWSQAGYYLKSRPKFTFDPLLHAGMYYVEEPSSMFVEQAFTTAKSMLPLHRVLDLCAAPGGKSTLLRGLMEKGDLLVSNEPVAKRTAILSENMTKWGDPDVAVTCNYPEAFAGLEGYFDLILADVPCSGEGMFRKDMQAREEWSAKAVENCALRQREIIGSVWNALRGGGFLIYSTCTFNRNEDEDNVQWIAETLGAEIVQVKTQDSWNISGDMAGGNADVYHFFPHRTRGEGFFLALLRKKAEECHAADNLKKIVCRNKPEVNGDFAHFLRNSEDFGFYAEDSTIYARRNELCGDYALLQRHLNVVTAGIPVATEKQGKRNFGKDGRNKKKNTGNYADFTPAQGLAMSTELDCKAFEQVETDYANAIKYLRGETLTPERQYQRGYVLVTYRGVPLGFANNVGTRLNNAYPQAWRIRSTYAPDSPPVLDL